MSWKQAGVSFIRMAVLLVLVSMAAFFLVSVSPLDPLTTNVGQAALGSMSRYVFPAPVTTLTIPWQCFFFHSFKHFTCQRYN